MIGIPAELVLFIGGGFVTAVLAVVVITLLVKARREHERVLLEERREREVAARKFSASQRSAPSCPDAATAPTDAASNDQRSAAP